MPANSLRNKKLAKSFMLRITGEFHEAAPNICFQADNAVWNSCAFLRDFQSMHQHKGCFQQQKIQVLMMFLWVSLTIHVFCCTFPFSNTQKSKEKGMCHLLLGSLTACRHTYHKHLWPWG